MAHSDKYLTRLIKSFLLLPQPMVMTHQTPARRPDTMTLHDHIAAIGNNLYQLDDMSQADICDLADQLD
jgi:hypothetical protein